MTSVGYGPSIVELRSDESGHSCGYCHSNDTSFSNGMWAHTMTVEDYQNLVDRGWRRSGHYCYKPIMTSTCCPMYTIKCAAREFRVSKSQKKILKRFHNFLAYGVMDKGLKPSFLKKTEVVHSLDVPGADLDIQREKPDILLTSSNKLEMGDTKLINEPEPQQSKQSEIVNKTETSETDTVKSDQSKKGKSRQMKAKYLRLERKRQKLRNMGLTEKEIEDKIRERKRCITIKTLEDFLNKPQPENPAHKLEIRLVRSFPAASGLEETFEIFKRYQIHIHNDPPEKISLRKFQRFLVVSPLEVLHLKKAKGGHRTMRYHLDLHGNYFLFFLCLSGVPFASASVLKIRLVLVKSPEFEKAFAESVSLFAKYQKAVHEESDGDCNSFVFNYFLVDSPLEPKKCYGSYHQQYWLDGKLIAVGVIDILPKCLSSVYFLYDPDYMWLSLGTYGALRELEFVRKLTSQNPDIEYYYMGFYIHSCVKMRYKAAFKPSYLLCPETYTWHPIHTCLPKLDISKYSRLNEDPSVKDSNSTIILSDISILYKRTVMSFASYARQKKCSPEEREEILKYATLVGMICAKKILLYRP